MNNPAQSLGVTILRHFSHSILLIMSPQTRNDNPISVMKVFSVVEMSVEVLSNKRSSAASTKSPPFLTGWYHNRPPAVML